MRAENRGPRFPYRNIALLLTLERIFKLLQSRCLCIDPRGNTLRDVNDWESCIFHESCIRLASLYFVPTIVALMEIGFNCSGPTDWRTRALLLPAPKVSWEADSEVSWVSSTGSFNGSLSYLYLTTSLLTRTSQITLSKRAKRAWIKWVCFSGIVGSLYSTVI